MCHHRKWSGEIVNSFLRTSQKPGTQKLDHIPGVREALELLDTPNFCSTSTTTPYTATVNHTTHWGGKGKTLRLFTETSERRSHNLPDRITSFSKLESRMRPGNGEMLIVLQFTRIVCPETFLMAPSGVSRFVAQTHAFCVKLEKRTWTVLSHK